MKDGKFDGYVRTYTDVITHCRINFGGVGDIIRLHVNTSSHVMSVFCHVPVF